MKEMEYIIFDIISNGGNAKGLCYEAIKSAENGDFEKSESLLKEADEFLTIAHNTQTDLLQKEAAGNSSEVSLLLVHAQDHLMTSIEVRSLATHFIALAKRLSFLENK